MYEPNSNSLNKRYSTVCPHCHLAINPTMSMGMLFGMMNTGHGECPHCKKLMMLEYNKESDTMSAKKDPISDQINLKRDAEKVYNKICEKRGVVNRNEKIITK